MGRWGIIFSAHSKKHNLPESKYSSMPELMLKNRAATFFGRQYIPDLLLGVQTSEEVIDIVTEPINVSESSVAEVPKKEDENDLGF